MGLGMFTACLLSAFGALPSIAIISDSRARAYGKFADEVAQRGYSVERFVATDTDAIVARATSATSTVWIAMGPVSVKELAHLEVPTRIALLAHDEACPEAVACLRYGVPLDRQLAWIQRMFLGRDRIVLLRSPLASATADEALVRHARSLGVTLDIVYAATPRESIYAVNRALRRNADRTVLWLLPDPRALALESVPALIESTVAMRVPVFGFSPYFLQFGAVAALDIDPRALANEALALQAPSKHGVHEAVGMRVVVDAKRAERLGVVVSREVPGLGVQP